MHPTALTNCAQFIERYEPGVSTLTPRPRVVEVGSQDVNGSLRSVCPPHFDYVGVDFVAGRGVDIILEDPYTLPFESGSVDIAMASSVFEHSEMFWLLFLEIMRILKPTGLFYLNVPSNGDFHRWPVDCWRFYPDSGNALATWARRNGMPVALLESYVSVQCGDQWNDFVAVFLKDGAHAALYPGRILDTKTDVYNGIVAGKADFLNHSVAPQDRQLIVDMVHVARPAPQSTRHPDLAAVTAVCIDTLHHDLALSACRRMAEHGFREVVLFTDLEIQQHITDPLPTGMRIETIAPLDGKDAYSQFVMHELDAHVQTPHALVFQWDGFVVNPGKWWDGFLEYDYIGAPWPGAYARNSRRVGNSGFSL